MNKKQLFIGIGAIACLMPIAILSINNLNNKNNVNSELMVDEVIEEKYLKLDFTDKTPSQMRDYYSNEGLEFIKKIYPDSTSSDFALINIGRQLDKELKDFKFTTADNKEVKLKDLKGKKVILDFALTDCNTCKDEASFITKYNFKKEDIVFLHIFPRETTSQIKDMLKTVGGEFNKKHTVSSTGTNGFTFEDLNVTNVPAKIFIDEKGIVQYTFVGGINDEETLKLHLERAFDEDMPKMLDYLK